jgi:hypothetical protein
MTRIAFVLPYFGQWPAWFEAFLVSCSSNPGVDWLIFTDCNVPEHHPRNVIFRKMELGELARLGSERLGRKIEIRDPYKACDWKPFYGHIFAEYLAAYDFWGHCDMDVIWGDIASHFSDDMLKRYDVLTPSSSGVIGHCTIYRNTPELTDFAVAMPFRNRELGDPDCRGTDENLFNAYIQRGRLGVAQYGILKVLTALVFGPPLRSILWKKPWYEKLHRKWHFRPESRVERWLYDGIGRPARMFCKQLQKSGLDMANEIPTNWNWERGRIYDAQGEEWMYLHFHRWKDRPIHVGFHQADGVSAFAIDVNEESVEMKCVPSRRVQPPAADAVDE